MAEFTEYSLKRGFSVAEAAVLLGRSRHNIADAIRRGKLKATKVKDARRGSNAQYYVIDTRSLASYKTNRAPRSTPLICPHSHCLCDAETSMQLLRHLLVAHPTPDTRSEKVNYITVDVSTRRVIHVFKDIRQQQATARLHRNLIAWPWPTIGAVQPGVFIQFTFHHFPRKYAPVRTERGA